MENNSLIDDEEEESAAPLLTLRGLLLLVACVAITVAFFASYLRYLTRGQWTLLAAHLSVGALSFVAFLVIYGTWRRRLEQQAGPLRVASQRSWRRPFRFLLHDVFLGMAILVPILACHSLMHDLQLMPPPFRIAPQSWPLTIATFAVAPFCLALALWRFELVQLRKNGVLQGLDYQPWDELTVCDWCDDAPDLLQLRWGKTNLTFFVPPQDRPGVERLLEKAQAKRPPVAKA